MRTIKTRRFWISTFALIFIVVTRASTNAKSFEITCEFTDEGKMPKSIRIKAEVFEADQRVGFGTDVPQPRFVRFTALPSDTATRLTLKFTTTKADEWTAEPPDTQISADAPISFGPVLIIHRPSVLNEQIAKAESASADNIPAAKEALTKAQSLLLFSAERLRWARAQDKVLALDRASFGARQAAFSRALRGIDRSRLSHAESFALTQQEFDLLSGTIEEKRKVAGNSKAIDQTILSDTNALESGKTPREELASLALNVSKVTPKVSMESFSRDLDQHPTKAVKKLSLALKRSF
jgi:hypothetical protein